MASSYWISSVNQEKKRKDIIYDKIRNSALNVTEINEELMVYLEWLGADPGIYVEGGGTQPESAPADILFFLCL